MTSPLPCPNCKSRYSAHVAPTGRILCINCTREWESQASYDITAMLLGLPEFEEEPDYIDDGGLQGDLDKLIHLVSVSAEASLAREVLKSARDLCDGKSYSAALREVMDFLQNLVTVTEHMEERARE